MMTIAAELGLEPQGEGSVEGDGARSAELPVGDRDVRPPGGVGLEVAAQRLGCRGRVLAGREPDADLGGGGGDEGVGGVGDAGGVDGQDGGGWFVPHPLHRAPGADLLYAVEHAGPEDRERLIELYALDDPSEEQLAEIVRILERVGARDYTRDTALRYRDQALAELDAAGVVEPAARARLQEIIVGVISA